MHEEQPEFFSMNFGPLRLNFCFVLFRVSSKLVYDRAIG
jgi:hypothetical protein